MDPRNDAEDDETFEDGDEQEAGFDEMDDEDVEEEDDEDQELRNSGRDTERELDHGLKETFPASDPVSINPGAD